MKVALLVAIFYFLHLACAIITAPATHKSEHFQDHLQSVPEGEESPEIEISLPKNFWDLDEKDQEFYLQKHLEPVLEAGHRHIVLVPEFDESFNLEKRKLAWKRMAELDEKVVKRKLAWKRDGDLQEEKRKLAWKRNEEAKVDEKRKLAWKRAENPSVLEAKRKLAWKKLKLSW